MTESSKQKLVITNIAQILTGKLEEPLIDGDCVISVDGKIAEIGYQKELDTSQATTSVNANGTWLSPGLIDSHVHPVIGDFTPGNNN